MKRTDRDGRMIQKLRKELGRLQDDLNIANRIIDKQGKNLAAFKSIVSDIRDIIRDSHNQTTAPTYNELHHSITTILIRAIPHYE